MGGRFPFLTEFNSLLCAFKLIKKKVLVTFNAKGEFKTKF